MENCDIQTRCLKINLVSHPVCAVRLVKKKYTAGLNFRIFFLDYYAKAKEPTLPVDRERGRDGFMLFLRVLSQRETQTGAFGIWTLDTASITFHDMNYL